ncbi:MAG: hypothetical protein ACMVY4_20375 [Minwuia sp.]|uniref:hypothetical protein n=1 Tax=Minwuia sp. TaxID=2493630 RepID=UPI003A87B142
MTESPLPLSRLRIPIAAVLSGVATLVIAAAIWLGTAGFAVTESFRLADAETVQGAMRVYRIDYAAWEQHPFQVIDDGRHGETGTASALFVDGERVTTGRASRTVMVEGREAAFLHAGLQNFYFSPPPGAPSAVPIQARFQVVLEPAVALGIGAAAILLLLTGFGLLTRIGLLVDLGMALTTLAAVAGLWLSVEGVSLDRPVPVETVRELPPHGYIVRFEPPFGLVTPATDRLTPVIRGWLTEDGERFGTPTALGTEVRDPGAGFHIWSRGGSLYFSTPDNTDPRENGRTYVLQQQAFLSPHIAGAFGAVALLSLLAAATVGAGRLSRAVRMPKPRTVALALPGSVLAIMAGYVGWLLWIDPLHLMEAPEQRDWFAGDEPHRIAGLIRTYPYEAVLIGTSVVQNVYMDHASEALGKPVLNAAIAGSSPLEQARLVDRAAARASTKMVVWEVHLTGFTQPPDASRFEWFPYHLVDGNPLTDLEYLFSLQAWLDANDARAVRLAATTGPLDPINKWGERLDFGPVVVAKTWCERRHRPAGEFRTDNLRANLRRHVRPLAEAHPDVEFVLFVPPYSAMMHMPQGGFLLGTERAAAIILEEMNGLPNVRLHDFQGLPGIAGDAERFRDDMHARPDVTRRIIDGIADGTRRIEAPDLAAHEATLLVNFRDAEAPFRAAVEPYCES